MTRESLGQNFDIFDNKLINLKKELERVFKMKNLVDVSKLMMEENIPLLQEILSKSQKNLTLEKKLKTL